MCLAVPAEVLEIKGPEAKVDYGGVVRTINVALVTVKVGEYVIVHAGYAIQVMNAKEAKETLKLWQELLEFGEPIEPKSLKK